MSGPIVRKYGFPNFEKIFGERELKHGGQDDAPKPDVAPKPSEPPARGPTDEAADPKKP